MFGVLLSVLLVGASVATATPRAAAASQNEVVMSLLWDGTPSFTGPNPLHPAAR